MGLKILPWGEVRASRDDLTSGFLIGVISPDSDFGEHKESGVSVFRVKEELYFCEEVAKSRF